jgi:DNA helicase-2/ATP-dependent DNA helicase PcrA
LVKPTRGSGTALGANEMAKLEIGTKVKHDRFGKGEIVGLEGEIPNKKATVEFRGVGKKQLLLKFAKLQIIES